MFSELIPSKYWIRYLDIYKKDIYSLSELEYIRNGRGEYFILNSFDTIPYYIEKYNKVGLMTSSHSYKPFRYPWAFDFWKRQQQVHCHCRGQQLPVRAGRVWARSVCFLPSYPTVDSLWISVSFSLCKWVWVIIRVSACRLSLSWRKNWC